MREKGLTIETGIFGLALAAMVVCAFQVRMGTDANWPTLLVAFLVCWTLFVLSMSAIVRMFRA